MRQFIRVWGSGWLLALTLAGGGWAQMDPNRVAALPAPPDLDQREAQLSPYQRWQQQHAAAEIPFEGIFYHLLQEAEQRPEGLPFPLQPAGIPLGEGSPFFLRANGLVYRVSY
ncbi:hypothetical protein [Synechococcus sp. H70.2]|uniref:hypothetical protein n=1 Tax=Synechococcus sp. H70.2 TaxID=2964528 RepID=UPI0039C1779D